MDVPGAIANKPSAVLGCFRVLAGRVRCCTWPEKSMTTILKLLKKHWDLNAVSQLFWFITENQQYPREHPHRNLLSGLCNAAERMCQKALSPLVYYEPRCTRLSTGCASISPVPFADIWRSDYVQQRTCRTQCNFRRFNLVVML